MNGLVSTQLVVSLVTAAIVVHVILVLVAYCIYLERKISAYIQDRVGPNRVGFDFGQEWLRPLRGAWGLGQPLADGIKFLLKEDYAPRNVDKILFTLAPVMSLVPALLGFMIIPWGGMWSIGDETVHVAGAVVNVGIIYLLAVASIGAYGITVGGWASNNKYSFLGGLRATAQMISYEIPLGLSLLAALLVLGTFLPTEIITYQIEHGWLIASQPIACVLFFVCALAEANRAPFDNAEAEQELVGGYHTEYSSMRFALFFLAEYAHMITSSAFFALIFLGGYHLPFVGLTSPESTSFLAVVTKFGVYFGKVVLLVCLMMWIRWTLPRLRYDQVMMLNWQSLIPLSLALVVGTSVMVHLGQTSLPAMLLFNVGVVVAVMLIQPLVRAWFGNPTANSKIALYGSRFSPVAGEAVSTAPTEAMALEDRPVEGTAESST